MKKTFAHSSDALVGLAHELLDQPVVPSRNGDTRELAPNCFQLSDPLHRHLHVAGRRNSLPATLYETLWVLEGSSGEIGYLSRFLPRAADFSDDGGETWRGAYGPRLRSFRGVDQVQAVIDILRKDPGSRRAVMVLFDPSLDLIEDSLDIPCNNWLQFRVVNGKLDLSVVVRSNDLIWGWSGINSFEWSALQEYIARELGVPMGTQTWFQGSLHVYEHHWDRCSDLRVVSPDCRTWAAGVPQYFPPGEDFSSLLGYVHSVIDGGPERWYSPDSIWGVYVNVITRYLKGLPLSASELGVDDSTDLGVALELASTHN